MPAAVAYQSKDAKIAQVDARGVVTPVTKGSGHCRERAGIKLEVPVEVLAAEAGRRALPTTLLIRPATIATAAAAQQRRQEGLQDLRAATIPPRTTSA
jgi:hypothetical protein